MNEKSREQHHEDFQAERAKESLRVFRKINSAPVQVELSVEDMAHHSFVLGRTRDGMGAVSLAETEGRNKASASGLLAGLLRRM